jgi:hypothetical protein
MALTRRSSITAVAVLAIASALSGCFSFATVTTAEPVAPGEFEFTVAPNVTGFSAAAFGESLSGAVLLSPTVDFYGRLGVVEDVDIAISYTGWMQTNFDLKWRFLHTESLDVAINPHVGGIFWDIGSVGAGYVSFGLPVLVDFPLSERFIFTVAPKWEAVSLLGSVEGGGSASEMLHYVGMSFAFQIAFEDSRRFLIQPYGGFVVWANPPSGADITTLNFNMGIGFKLRL